MDPMAKWYLINDTQHGSHLLRAGKLVDDTVYNAAKIIASGGVLWPASDPIVAAASATITAMKRRGVPADILQPLMLAATVASSNGSVDGSAGNVYGIVQKASVTVGFAQLTAAATTQTLALAPFLLPAGARVIGRQMNVTAAFTGGGLSSMTVSVGDGVSADDIISGQSVFTLLGIIEGAAGSNPIPLYPAQTQVNVLFTGSGDVNLATAGSVTIDLLYIVVP
jgi:hypothetical protein